MIDTVKSVDLFSWIDIEPTYIWENLIYLDSGNYGGISAAETNEENGADADEKDPANSIICHWNIAEYLPELAQEYFLVIISEWILEPHKNWMKLKKEEEAMDEAEVMTREERAEALTKFNCELVEGYISRKLFKMIPDVKKQLSGDSRSETSDAAFPQLPGSHLKLTSPSLELIKYVTHVMLLDPKVENQVTVLKRNLLRLVEVTGFSPKAAFTDPCLTFVMPDTICSYCNLCRDLDLCRDPHLLDGAWKCPTCSQPYNKNAIEMELVRTVQKRMVSFQVQDLVCDTCKATKIDNMSEYCPCSGHYRCNIDSEEMSDGLTVFAKIADYHKFPFLKETVEFVQDAVNKM